MTNRETGICWLTKQVAFPQLFASTPAFNHERYGLPLRHQLKVNARYEESGADKC
jgi:hypothetical protein